MVKLNNLPAVLDPPKNQNGVMVKVDCCQERLIICVEACEKQFYICMIYYDRWRAIDKSIFQFVRELCHARVRPGACALANKPSSGFGCVR